MKPSNDTPSALRAPAVLVLGTWLLCLTPSALDQAASLSEDAAPEGLSKGDWAGIRAAYEAGRHAAYPVEGGYQARNPGQGWRTHFDGRGFLTQPIAGSWTWGLELERYGFAGCEQEVTRPERVSAEGGRVAYAWDATLEEWFENDTRGLEHGYTVRSRPPCDEHDHENRLTFTLTVRGELRPEVTAAGRGVRFLDEAGAVVLTYTELSVFDADGRDLDASFETAGSDGLLLYVDDAGARYPVTIDPIAQQAYLKASNTDAGDRFGVSVAVSGDTVVVGASGEDSNATGVNGNQSDNSALDAGAAYVFVRSGTSWSQQAYLKASNTDADDSFGISVAISDDTAVVSAYSEDSSATGVDGDQSDNSAGGAGAAYVFVRSGTSWSQEAYLKASNTDAGDSFGRSVAIVGDIVGIGAHVEDSSATGANGNGSDNSANNSGAAYVFSRRGTTWTQEAYLKASNTDANDVFGVSIAISGDTVVVGAMLEDSSVTGVNGNQSDDSATFAGAAYVFGLDLGLGTTYCPAGLNSTGAPAAISASGSASVAANNLLLRAESVPNQPGIFFYGPQQASLPFGNGTLCITGQIARLDVVNAGGNMLTFLVDNTSPPSAATQITAGSTWNFQAWFRDPAAGGANFNLSDGYTIQFTN